MLPLGLRVQEKLEGLIDKHMKSVKASKVSLSSISSQALWEKSGRLKRGGETFTFKDRKETGWLLAPTHEEEITTLLADVIQSPQQLPVRLYQIGRKYRDEKRPRGGLLRGREFLMKDLYTFDSTPGEAHTTYDEIRAAYRNFLDELKIDYIEARAVSGDMGGNLSHEYHFPNSAGEDIVITCTDCGYARNEEFVSQGTYQSEPIQKLPKPKSYDVGASGSQPFIQEDFLGIDGRSLVRAIAPPYIEGDSKDNSNTKSLNSYAIKAALNGIIEIDSGLEDPLGCFTDVLEGGGTNASTKIPSIYYLLDSRISPNTAYPLIAQDMQRFSPNNAAFYLIRASADSQVGINLLKHQAGDHCPECQSGTLKVDKAIEVGHTFHLGTRYSAKLGLATRQNGGKDLVPVEMGCHGIGVSRLIAAVASCLSDDSGLNWPKAIAPFETVIVVQKSHTERMQAAEQLYDDLTNSKSGAVDVLLDDRQEQGLGWKLKDADMIGYPVIVVVGKAFDQGKVEIQCRRLNVKQDVEADRAVEYVHTLLEQL